MSEEKGLTKARPSRLSMEGYIYNANEVLTTALNPNTKIVPVELFEKCKGIVILTVFHVGAVMSIHYGTGVVMKKKIKDGNNEDQYEWSLPSAVGMAGYSMGVVAGGKVDRVLSFIMDDETMDDFIARPQTRMGLDATFAAGKAGGDANLGIDQGTVSIFFSTGAFAGLSLQMGTMTFQKKQNEVFYGKENIHGKDVMVGSELKPPEESQIPDLHKKLEQLARGETWVPSQDDLQRSSHFLNKAQEASMRFQSGSIEK